MKPLKNYVIVEFKRSTTTTKKTKGGLYVLSQPVEDTTKSGEKIDTTSVIIVATGPDANPELKPGQAVAVNYYEVQVLNEVEEGKIFGVLPDDEVKVILKDVQ